MPHDFLFLTKLATSPNRSKPERKCSWRAIIPLRMPLSFSRGRLGVGEGFSPLGSWDPSPHTIPSKWRPNPPHSPWVPRCGPCGALNAPPWLVLGGVLGRGWGCRRSRRVSWPRAGRRCPVPISQYLMLLAPAPLRSIPFPWSEMETGHFGRDCLPSRSNDRPENLVIFGWTQSKNLFAKAFQYTNHKGRLAKERIVARNQQGHLRTDYREKPSKW
jgi:hypothetical protein